MTLKQEKATLKPRKCRSCKRMVMKDPTNNIDDAYCNFAWCPQYRKVCWTCDVNKFGQHTDTQEIKRMEKKYGNPATRPEENANHSQQRSPSR